MRKAGLEPARAMLTTPSRWRVYQFHHFRENYFSLNLQYRQTLVRLLRLFQQQVHRSVLLLKSLERLGQLEVALAPLMKPELLDCSTRLLRFHGLQSLHPVKG